MACHLESDARETGGPAEREFQILVIGENSCGKSALMNRFTGAPDATSTYGEKLERTIILDDEKVRITCWDLADTPRWITFHPRDFYKSADGIIILYSSVDMESFDLARELYEEVKRVLGPNMHKVNLVGTKCDLSHQKEVNFMLAKVSQANQYTSSAIELQKFAESHDMLLFEVSSEDGMNVEFAFSAIITKVLNSKT